MLMYELTRHADGPQLRNDVALPCARKKDPAVIFFLPDPRLHLSKGQPFSGRVAQRDTQAALARISLPLLNS